MLVLRIENGRECGQIARHLRMYCPQRLLADGHGAAGIGFSRGVTAPRIFEASEIVIHGGDFDMLRAERLLHDGEGAAVEPLRILEPARVLAANRPTVQNRGYVKIV